MSMHGEIFWNECATRDADKAKAFYAALMGWEMMDGPSPDGTGRYIVAKKGDKMIGGIFPMQGEAFEGIPPHWMTYLAVDDVEAACAKAKALGGSIIREPFAITGVGTIAIIKDAGGAVVGLAESAQGAEA